MDWNDEMITRLGALWSDGHSTAEIGRRLGITKNAVVGKAHRMNLKPRPSPIRWADAATRRTTTVPASTPINVSANNSASVAVAVPPAAASQPAPVPTTPAISARPHAAFQPAGVSSRLSARTSSCCWPIGEPGTARFRFCDADATAGRPYCAEHAQLAYVKVRDRRENAA